MSTKQYQTYIKLLNSAIFQKGTFGDILPKLLQLTQGSQHLLFIDMVCTELSNGFVNKTSEVVNRATHIFSELAILGSQQLTLRMAQKDFQQNLAYTLRGKTSVFGNRFTMHPLIWIQIENRVLKIYEYWFKKYMLEENKYHNILQKYRYLKSLKIKFPEQQILIKKKIDVGSTQKKEQQNVKQQTTEPKPRKSTVPNLTNQQLNQIQELVVKYENYIYCDQISKLLNDQTVRLIKGKSLFLYNIFNQKHLQESAKTKVKDYYSRFRAVLKKIDQENDKLKLQEQKKFIQQKMGLMKNSKSTQQTKINTPIKKLKSNQQSPVKQQINLLQQSTQNTNNNKIKQIVKLNQQIDIFQMNGEQPTKTEKINTSTKPKSAQIDLFDINPSSNYLQGNENKQINEKKIDKNDQQKNVLQKTPPKLAEDLFSFNLSNEQGKFNYQSPSNKLQKSPFSKKSQESSNKKDQFSPVQHQKINKLIESQQDQQQFDNYQTYNQKQILDNQSEAGSQKAKEHENNIVINKEKNQKELQSSFGLLENQLENSGIKFRQAMVFKEQEQKQNIKKLELNNSIKKQQKKQEFGDLLQIIENKPKNTEGVLSIPEQLLL